MQLAIVNAMADVGWGYALSYDSHSEVADRLADLDSPAFVVGNDYHGLLHTLFRLLAQPIDCWRLVRFCKRNDVDVLFEVMGHPLQDLPRLLLRLFGVPTIISVHDATRHPGEESIFLSVLDRVSRRNTDGIMVYSAATAKALGNLEKPVFETVHGAFGQDQGSGQSREFPTRRPVVGFFGRIHQYKGLTRLTAAVLQLRDEGMDVELRIVGRGDIDPEARRNMTLLGATIDNRWVDESEIPEIIQSFDILALPYDEASQSGVVGFALRSGVPIVATPVGGLAEQIRMSGGLVADSMSVGDYAAAIRAVVSSEANFQAISEAQKRAANDTFSWRRVIGDIRSAAESMMISARRRS